MDMLLAHSLGQKLTDCYGEPYTIGSTECGQVSLQLEKYEYPRVVYAITDSGEYSITLFAEHISSTVQDNRSIHLTLDQLIAGEIRYNDYMRA